MLADEPTNTASVECSVKTEVNLQVLLSPTDAAPRAPSSRSNTNNATATTDNGRNVQSDNEVATLNSYVTFDFSRLCDNCRSSYSKEKLDKLEEYNSDSEDGSYYEDMPGLSGV